MSANQTHECSKKMAQNMTETLSLSFSCHTTYRAQVHPKNYVYVLFSSAFKLRSEPPSFSFHENSENSGSIYKIAARVTEV